MNKRRWMLGSAIMLVVLLVAGGTLAWFTATAGPVENEFTAGTIELSVNECFNECDAWNVNPGDTVKKHVKFCNDGTKRMFVRVQLEEEFTDKNGDPLDSEGIVSYDIGEGWVLHGDYYYYTEEVLPDKCTPFIITEVKFSGPEMDNTYQGSEFTLTVNSEAIQVTNGAAAAEWGVYPPDLPLP